MNEDAAPSRVKRMLPSVSEVLKELTARAPVEPDVAFRAAREVCAEELKRIRDAGGDSVPLEELVQRALVRVAGGRSQVPMPPAPVAPPAPPPPRVEPAPAYPPAETTAEDPFSETAGAMDLRWDRDAREPFTEPQTAAPAPFILPAEPEVVDVPVPEGGPAPIPEPEPEAVEGPGDETLNRLSREAESIDLETVFPKSHEGEPFRPAPSAAGAPSAALPPPEPVPPPFEDDEDTVLTIPRGSRPRRPGEESGTRVGALLGIAAGLVALAGLGYLLVGLWMERDASPPPVAVARPRPAAEASPAPAEGGAASPTVAPAASPAAAPAAATPAPTVAPFPTVAPIPTVAPPPAVAPAQVRVEPSRVPAAATAAAATAPAPTLVRSVPVRQSRDGLVVTRDREGLPEIWSIHFTSYRDRASAERDLKRVTGLAGRPGYVAEVDLGEKGTWHRVMVGSFATAQEAKAVRDELAAKGTPDMGWVYRVVGPE